MLLIDHYTRMTWVCFLKKKLESFECFKIFKEMVENDIDLKIRTLRLDNGGEFTSNEFCNYCEKHGIKSKFSASRTPQQKGVLERKNGTVEEMARTMLNDSKLNDIFWLQSVHTTFHILNIWFPSELKVTKIHMGYEKEDQQLSSTSEFLETSAT